VGIGTASPSAKLHINTGATEGATFTKYETTGNGYGGIEFRGTRGNGTNGSTIGQISSYWQNNTRGSIIFNDGGDISILPTRNVGIGTTSPDVPLHVNGNALIGDSGAYGSVTHTDAQLTLGGTHNTGYNTNDQIKLLITGGNNDGGSPYYIMCEDENGHDQFWVKGATSDNGTDGIMYLKGSMKNNNPCFYARRTSSRGVGVYIFNVEELDSHNAYNTINGRFTAPIAGRYVFNVWAMSNGNTLLYLEIMKNGSRVYNASPYTGAVGSYANVAGTIVINLAVNDYIYINVVSGAAYGGGNDHNGFCGYMIG
jgi:hypothetical protein